MIKVPIIICSIILTQFEFVAKSQNNLDSIRLKSLIDINELDSTSKFTYSSASNFTLGEKGKGFYFKIVNNSIKQISFESQKDSCELRLLTYSWKKNYKNKKHKYCCVDSNHKIKDYKNYDLFYTLGDSFPEHKNFWISQYGYSNYLHIISKQINNTTYWLFKNGKFAGLGTLNRNRNLSSLYYYEHNDNVMLLNFIDGQLDGIQKLIIGENKYFFIYDRDKFIECSDNSITNKAGLNEYIIYDEKKIYGLRLDALIFGDFVKDASAIMYSN